MSIITTFEPHYLCPICRNDLLKNNKSFVCDNNHCFDIAKEGYVNLLPVQQKKSKNPGDNKLMIQSRRDFLHKHYYDCIIQPCVDLIDGLIAKHENCCIVDIGCGDGYFTRNIHSKLTKPSLFYGMDISKSAIKSSAKSDKSVAWFVASFNDMPLRNESIDIMLKINSPLNYQKSYDKLSSRGIVLSVTPGESHLDGLKTIIYENPENHLRESQPDGFKLLATQNVSQDIQLNSNRDINNLFMMTPFYWNASLESKEKIKNLNQLKTSIDFNFNAWEKQ